MCRQLQVCMYTVQTTVGARVKTVTWDCHPSLNPNASIKLPYIHYINFQQELEGCNPPLTASSSNTFIISANKIRIFLYPTDPLEWAPLWSRLYDDITVRQRWRFVRPAVFLSGTGGRSDANFIGCHINFQQKLQFVFWVEFSEFPPTTHQVTQSFSGCAV